jgi:transcriptional regulator of acetoin/glycerol metabolism
VDYFGQVGDGRDARGSRARGEVALPSDQNRLALAREHFLTQETVEPRAVRESILASWWRSRRSQVVADHVAVPYVDNPDLDLPLARSADDLLRRLAEQLDGQPVSLILTDRAGMVLRRLTGDSGLHRHLDRVLLAPGFRYAEDAVGTNGIGTALENGRASHVFGHEHYAEYLEDLACAGVPIRHPITGKTVGAVDLTCWRKDAGPLLLTLAKTAADQISQALLADTGVHELELFRAYLQACRRTTGMVLALADDLIIMNELTRKSLDPADQSVLLRSASEALAEGRRGPMLVALPGGETARMSFRPVHATGHTSGAVLTVNLVEQPEDSGAGGVLLRMFLPGLVGSGALWLRCCHEADRAHRAGEWVILSGEPGVGKLALARAIHQRYHASCRFPVVDAAALTGPEVLAQVRTELHDRDARALAVTHVDRLPAEQLSALAELLRGVPTGAAGALPWVVVTEGAAGGSEPGSAALRELFPTTVEVPPLRHHIEDLTELVSFLLARLSHGGGLHCSPEVMHRLRRSTWPGNVAQLRQVLSHVVAHHRRAGAILPTDLPPDYHAVSRRPLSQLESIERDAIIETLMLSGGNKQTAAKSLGVSRATIYRRIHEYGIVTPD